MEKEKETLFINLSSSRCGNCNKETLPDTKTHEQVSGYSTINKEEKGCGAEWKYVSSDYTDTTGELEKSIKKMRPDLIYLESNILLNK